MFKTDVWYHKIYWLQGDTFLAKGLARDCAKPYVIPLFPPYCKYNYSIAKRLWTYLLCVDFGK
jgi:hypothetical protein